MSVEFDILICVGPNDKDIINKQIEYTKKNVIGYRNIYLVMPEPLIHIEGTKTINEDIYPFSLESILEKKPFFGVPPSQGPGWYFQQLVKMLSFYHIEGILEKYLVIDCDTFFLKPTNFFEDKIPLYNTGNQFHQPYFKHMLELSKEFTKTTKSRISGICHHMIYEKIYMDEIVSVVEKNHGKKFEDVFIEKISVSDSGCSEYELYFHYIKKFHPNKMKIRNLNFADVGNINLLNNKKTYKYDYLSFHHYMRK